MLYPVAETFYSIQGEGMFAGTPMLFIRLAGCNVGKYVEKIPPGVRSTTLKDDFRVLHKEASICTTIDGESFVCDTDYRINQRMDIGQILEKLDECDDIAIEHVCITGGEPFLYDLEPLVDSLLEWGVDQVHIETSGTTPIKRQALGWWVTCCPKEGFLISNAPLIDEWKILLSPNITEKLIRNVVSPVFAVEEPLVYIQPINFENSVNMEELKKCVEFVKKYPWLKLSPQLHKWLGVR